MNTPYQPPDDVAETAPVIEATTDSVGDSYWSKSLITVSVILTIWAFISLGCGIVFREFLDSALPNIGGAPFGFWMAQQGSIIGFLILLVVYMLWMNRLDSQHGYDAGNE